MMGIKAWQFAPVESRTLEQLAPQDHFYRQVDRVLDLALRAGSGGAVLRHRRTTQH